MRDKLYEEIERAEKVQQGKQTFNSSALHAGSNAAIAQLHPDTTIFFADLVGKYTKNLPKLLCGYS